MPQRFLRPGIRTSPRWNSVSHRAARLYISILTLVDDFGRYDGRVSVLWAETWAVWNEQNPESAVNRQETAADCCLLAAEELCEFYENNEGRVFLQVTQWQERARNKSKWPDPNNTTSCRRLPMAAESCRLLPNPAPIAIAIASTPSPPPAPLRNPAAAAEESDEWAFKWLRDAQKNGADYTETEMRGSLLSLKANGFMWGKNKIVDPRAALERQIQTDRERKSNAKDNGRNRSQSTDRNAGTLNAGKAAQYANVGKVLPVPNPERPPS